MNFNVDKNHKDNISNNRFLELRDDLVSHVEMHQTASSLVETYEGILEDLKTKYFFVLKNFDLLTFNFDLSIEPGKKKKKAGAPGTAKDRPGFRKFSRYKR